MSKTSTEARVHNTVTERTRRFSPFNLLCMIGGPFTGIAFYVMSGELKPLWLIPASIVLGYPYKDLGSAHEALWLKLQRKNSAKPGSKTLSAPPFSNHGQTDTNPWHDVHMVVGRIQQGKATILVPMLTDPNEQYLTLYLTIESGAAPRWANGGSEEKFEWTNDHFKAVERALMASKEPDLWYSSFAICRPADKTIGYEYTHERVDKRYLKAAAAPEGAGVNRAARLLGQEALGKTKMIYDQAGSYLNYTAIRMPWPTQRSARNFWRETKADISDPKVFAKTNLYKTARQLVIHLTNCELSIEVATRYEVTNILLLTHCERFLDTHQTYAQRDREQVASKDPEFQHITHMDDTPSARLSAARPLSVSSDEDNPVFLNADGSFIGGAYVDAIVKNDLLPGFQDVALATPKRISFNVATIAKAPLVPREKRKARRAEMLKRMGGDFKSANHYMSEDLDATEAIDKTIERQHMLHTSGGRSGDFHIPVIWFGRSYDDLEENFEMLTLSMSNYYELKRLASPKEITDAIFATILVFN